ncbi:DICT sensory domain-containing protein [Haloplanus pelagicus]|uniref:DICT sensory domain-containing protein n=1 Tax=Haloplanus pelagicus TaxID=2949995 RepID=UPI00203E1E01|nr:DICT sensory domain-containing protein [Haloplanus sp. HW8-1]
MVADGQPTSLRDMFSEVSGGSLSLLTVNRTRPEQVQNLLADAFATGSVELSERSLPSDDDLLVLREDGEITAVSSLDRVMRSFLLVNGDQFTTSTRGFDEDVPAVLTGMDGTLFDLRGYPDSNKEKLLLVVISRHIERRAYEAGEGTLRATFQRLSRLEDESGTRQVYERLAGRPLDVHVYGVPDESPTWLDATVHAGTTHEYRRSWCVVYRPPTRGGVDDPGPGPAALVAHQRAPNRWRGFWTYDRERVERIHRYLVRSF